MIRFDAGAGSAVEINRRMRELAAIGAGGFSLATPPDDWAATIEDIGGDVLVQAPAPARERMVATAVGDSLGEAVERAAELGVGDIVLTVGLRVLDDIAMLVAARRRYPRLRVHVRNAEEMLDPLQPDVNLARLALAAMAATIGGAASIEPRGVDPKLAIRLLQTLEAETGVTRFGDLADGAEAIESRLARFV